MKDFKEYADFIDKNRQATIELKQGLSEVSTSIEESVLIAMSLNLFAMTELLVEVAKQNERIIEQLEKIESHTNRKIKW